MADTPLLTLSTTKTRQTVAIDGTRYRLRQADDFPLLEYRAQGRSFTHLGQLLQLKKPSRAQAAEQSRLLGQLVRAVLEAPEAVHQRLSETHRLEIVTAFSRLLSSSRMASTAGAKRRRPVSASRRRTRGR